MEIFGLPLHPLVVHSAVVLTPLAVIAAVAFALRPGWRYLLRIPTGLLAVAATISVWIAKLSGEDLDEARFAALPADNPVRLAIDTHEDRGTMLALVMIGFLVVVLLATRLLGGPSGLVSGKGAMAEREGWIAMVVPLAVVAISIVAMIWIVLTGDAGARAVWG